MMIRQKHRSAMKTTSRRLGWLWADTMRKAMRMPTMAKTTPWSTVYWATKLGETATVPGSRTP